MSAVVPRLPDDGCRRFSTFHLEWNYPKHSASVTLCLVVLGPRVFGIRTATGSLRAARGILVLVARNRPVEGLDPCPWPLVDLRRLT